MAGTCPLSSNLVTQSINFHGHQLLKQLTASHPKDIETLNLKEVDYNVCKARVPEIRKQGSLRQQELIHFITNKCQSLFVPREVNPLEDVGEDDYGMSDRRDRLPPIEYYMKVPKNIREDVFFKTVKRGHLLFVRVASYIHELLHCVKVQATLGNTVRDLFDTDIKAHLRLEDSQPEPVDQDNLGRWMLRTRLWVEVLEVDATDKYLLVGTNGVTIPPHMKDKVKLGKVTLNDRPAIISKMEDGTVAPYSEVLETLALYNNPRSIRHLASKFGINMFTHTSLMQTLRYKFPDREMYKNLRKAQMSRWAHKSVADGVVFFKRGQYEEAFQCLNKALQIDSENVEAFVAKGALLANLGRFEKAVEDFEQALKYNPKHSNACKYICETLVELGKQLEEADKMEEAEQKYKKCLEINPEHSAGLEAMNTLNRKLSRVKEQQTGDTELVQTVLRDLIEMEEEFKRKRHRTTSDSKSSPKSKTEAQPSRSTSSNPPKSRSQSKSLSPLSKKLALQEGSWHPPSCINTVQTYMDDCIPATMNVHPPPPPLAPSYGYPMTGWSPNAMNQMIHNPQVPPTAIFTQPPPGYPIIPPQGVSFDLNYASREDEEYKARVDKFLKQLEGSRFGDKKDRGKKSSTRESRRRRKHSKDSHKKKSRRNRSRSRSRRSRNGSRSISYSSSSSTSSSSSSTSSSSSSSTSLSSSSTSGTSDSSSRKKYKKKKYKKREKKEKQSKTGKLHKEKLEEKSKYPSNYSKVI